MDLIEALLEEERTLQTKLDAVRRMLAVYRRGNDSVPPNPTFPQPPQPPPAPPRAALSLRVDRFGSYGLAVVEKSIAILPDATGSPVMTRDLVDRLEREGMEVRGADKVNALSAILARSSRVKAHGRRGWTRAEPVRGVSAPKENEPTSGPAVGSDTANLGVQPPESAPDQL